MSAIIAGITVATIVPKVANGSETINLGARTANAFTKLIIEKSSPFSAIKGGKNASFYKLSTSESKYIKTTERA